MSTWITKKERLSLSSKHIVFFFFFLGGMVQFWYIFFPLKGGEFLSFGNDFTGLWGHTHGICLRQCDRQGEKCTWCHGRCVKMSKKCTKEFDTFVCYFCQWRVNIILCSDNKWLKEVVMLFLTTGCSNFPSGEGLFVIILCSIPKVFDCFSFYHEKQFPGVSRGLTHREANDKCIIFPSTTPNLARTDDHN